MRPLVAMVVLIWLAACGGIAVVDPAGSGGSGGETGASTTTTSASATTTTTSTGVGGAAVCGGFAGEACADGYFCDYLSDDCGGDDGQGICTPSPEGCFDEEEPICACDGMVYTNACHANQAGFDVSIDGCTPPPGNFACGPLFCSTSNEYCLIVFSDVPTEPDVYSCELLSPSCPSPPTCECLDELPPCDFASCEVTEGQLTVTCGGG